MHFVSFHLKIQINIKLIKGRYLNENKINILVKCSPVVFPWLCKEDITSVGHAALVDGVEGHDGHVEEHLGGVAWTQLHGYHGAHQTLEIQTKVHQKVRNHGEGPY